MRAGQLGDIKDILNDSCAAVKELGKPDLQALEPAGQVPTIGVKNFWELFAGKCDKSETLSTSQNTRPSEHHLTEKEAASGPRTRHAELTQERPGCGDE